jgi:hypothetical protein
MRSNPIQIYLNQLSFDLSLDHLSFEFVSIGSEQFDYFGFNCLVAFKFALIRYRLWDHF